MVVSVNIFASDGLPAGRTEVAGFWLIFFGNFTCLLEYDSEEEVAESLGKWSIRPESNEGIIVCVWWSEKKEHAGKFHISIIVSEIV
uniref:Uncharacterized protein n=1 Tax=Solanum tuberosum TaxID=4113 RepID=M1CX32_SOLTU